MTQERELPRRTETKIPKLIPKTVARVLVVTGVLATMGVGFIDLRNSSNRTDDLFNSKYPPLGTAEEVKTARADYASLHEQIDIASRQDQPLPVLTNDAETKLKRQIDLIKQDDQRTEARYNPPISHLLRGYALDLPLILSGPLLLAIGAFWQSKKKRA
ncbi:MAG: hypothetical protein Q7R44_00235 [bacterium]|nr:hypothetical protein [bacterium]